MAASIETGFFLLLVGMFTVFSVLAIVVVTGRLLILAINGRRSTLANEQVATKSETVATHQLPAETIAVISAAVLQATGGLGRIERVQRTE